MAYKIVLDAGHGGEDPGAVYKERKEKDDNLKLTLAVGKILEENGVDVTWVPVDGFRHEWRFWNLQIEKFLEWIPRTDAYAADQKQHRSV